MIELPVRPGEEALSTEKICAGAAFANADLLTGRRAA
jgi:hypothetical protein